jgi:hypothetical protein
MTQDMRDYLQLHVNAEYSTMRERLEWFSRACRHSEHAVHLRAIQRRDVHLLTAIAQVYRQLKDDMDNAIDTRGGS